VTPENKTISRFIFIDDEKEFFFMKNPLGMQFNFLMGTVGYYRLAEDEHDAIFQNNNDDGSFSSEHGDASSRIVSCWSEAANDDQIEKVYHFMIKKNKSNNEKKIHLCIVSTVMDVEKIINDHLGTIKNHKNITYYQKEAPENIYSEFNKKNKFYEENEYRFIVENKIKNLMKISFCTDKSYIDKIIILKGNINLLSTAGVTISRLDLKNEN